MAEQFERKIQEFLDRIKASEDSDEFLRLLREFRIYFEGIVDSERDVLSKNIGQLFVFDLQFFEATLKITDNLATRIAALEGRLQRIEESLDFRERHR